MTTPKAFTPLECLLLFQSLVAYGTKDDDFARISNLLINNTLVQDAKTYDVKRLGPESLRSLYLQLLDEELEAGRQNAYEEGGHATSKKRKIQSPPRPPLKDAHDYGSELSSLVDRLYARYRDYMIKAIQEEEKRISILQKEIEEIERGEWDKRMTEDGQLMIDIGNLLPTNSTTIPNGDSTSRPPKEAGNEAPTPKAIPAKLTSVPTQPFPAEAKADGVAIADGINNRVASPRPIDGPRKTPQVSSALHQRTGSNGPHGRSPLHPGTPQVGPPQPQNLQWEKPFVAGGQQVQFQQTPPFHPSQYQSQFANPQRVSSSTHGPLPHPHPTLPSSPMNHQQQAFFPPPNARISPASPGMPGMDALADAAGQQFRPNTGSPVPPQGQAAHGFQAPYPPHQRPASAHGAIQPQQWHPQHVQYTAHPQFAPPASQRGQFSPQPLGQPENRQYNSPYNANQSPRPSLPFSHPGQTTKSQPSLPSTPISQEYFNFMTGSGTRWTPVSTGLTPKPNVSAQSPAFEPLSPISRPVVLLGQSRRSNKKAIQKPEPTKPSRSQRRAPERPRAGSTASSLVDSSRRSQSVMSQTEEMSMDGTVRHVVKEEIATPRGIDDAGDTTADESSALPQLPSHFSSRQNIKRKRENSTVESRPSAPPGHVLWTRAFPKISLSAIESVTSHKNASTFANPVKERDAPGYKDLILRPQDLKSIAKAIAAGHRAATAAAPDDLDSSGTSTYLLVSEDLVPPKAIINYAQLEKELMRMFANAIMFNADPDRGLGRRWQGIGKEKDEIIGYEIDEDGVVKETRAMFADVEKTIADLRAAERKSDEKRDDARGSSMAAEKSNGEDDDIDELAGDADSSIGFVASTAKRRRKA